MNSQRTATSRTSGKPGSAGGGGSTGTGTTTSKASAAPFARRTREGDAHWVRVMETKENQWRFLHTLALHEMHVRESEACTELDGLSKQLDELVRKCDESDRVVKRCRTQRFQQQLVREATKPIEQVSRQLCADRYCKVANDVLDADSAVPIHSDGASIVEEIGKFKTVADRFRETADNCGVTDLTGLAEIVEKLAATVSMESTVVVDTATHVNRAARHSEIARSALLTDIVETEVPQTATVKS